MKTPIRILALSPIPEEGAGARFRLYQYRPALEQEGIHLTVQPFFTEEFFRIVYQEGRNVQKTKLFIARTLARLKVLVQRTQYDMFFVYREAFPIGPPILEFLFSKSKGRALIYDFDDAVFLPNSSDANQLIGVLKYPQKTSQIIRMSTHIITGNVYLAEYARKYNSAVSVIATCVDTARFIPRPSGEETKPGAVLRVGWIGSHSTVKYLQSILPVLQQVARRRAFSLYVVGCPTSLETEGLSIIQAPWVLAREVSDFQRCDVGVYPLWDDDWSRGKCGFKAIQFMACGVPVVASPVGVTKDIIQDGVNGFLATTEREWGEKLRLLLSDATLRQRLGEAGRQTVEARYSLAVQTPKLIATLQQAVERARGMASDGDSSDEAAIEEHQILMGPTSHR